MFSISEPFMPWRLPSLGSYSRHLARDFSNTLGKEDRRAEVAVENAIYDGALERHADKIIALAIALEN